MLDARFLTLTIYDGDQILEPHDSLVEAKVFASEVAGEGFDCAAIEVKFVARKVDTPYTPLEKLYGVVPGVDFPGSLCGRAV